MEQRYDLQLEQNLRQRMAEQLRWILIDSDIEFAELFTAIVAVGWGAWLLNPVWHAFSTTPSYAAMALAAPEWVWGGAVAGLGLMQAWALLIHQMNARRIATFLLCGLWLVVGITLAIANFKATGTVVYPSLSFAAGWAYLRLTARAGGEYGHVSRWFRSLRQRSEG